MDWKLISFVISVCFVQTVFCFIRFGGTKKDITECIGAGLNCSTRSECKSEAKGLFCFCYAGYTGETCQSDKDECDVGEPCRKRGVCHNAIGSFRCDCLPGWKGSHCQTSDGSPEASCVAGYTGVHCTDDFDECKMWKVNPCEHNSTCVNAPGNFSCTCATGWEGKICNEDINECNLTSGLCHNGGNCTNVPGDYKCVCPYPYTGAACSNISTTTTPIPSRITRHTGDIFSLSRNQTTTSSNATYANAQQNAPKDGGSINVGVIAGPVVGILVIAGFVLAGLVVYNKKSKVNPSEETEIGKTGEKRTTGDSNKNTTWKAATKDAVPKSDPDTLVNGTTS